MITGDWDLACLALQAWSWEVLTTELTTELTAAVGPLRQEEFWDEQVEEAEDINFCNWRDGGIEEYSDVLLIVGVGDKRPELEDAAYGGLETGE